MLQNYRIRSRDGDLQDWNMHVKAYGRMYDILTDGDGKVVMYTVRDWDWDCVI